MAVFNRWFETGGKEISMLLLLWVFGFFPVRMLAYDEPRFNEVYVDISCLSIFLEDVKYGVMVPIGGEVCEVVGDSHCLFVIVCDDIVLTASSEILLHRIIASLHQDPSRTPVDIESKLGHDGEFVSDLTFYRRLAEFRGVANDVAETCWLQNLLHDLHTPLSSATLVYCDNVSAVYLSSNPVQHQCTKNIEIDIQFVRDLVVVGQVRVLHVASH
ncbi:ribonuclease H-like domain-containing protein [Tanacetum coccineum]